MQGVPEPALALIRRLAAAALAALVLGVAGCGDSDDGKPRADAKPAGLPGDFNLQLFNCADWNAASGPVRGYVLRRLHEIGNDQVTGPAVQGRGSVLTDEQAIAMFNSTCASPRARGFVLYKIYAFSRGFRGGSPGGG